MRLFALVLMAAATAAAVRVASPAELHHALRSARTPALCMLATKRKKPPAKRSAPSKIAPRGFGAKAIDPGTLLSEPAYESMYEWLRASPKTVLHKVAVADFDGLRGVMAVQDIDAGEDIVSIPAEFAIDLGTQNQDPLPAARRLLQERAMDNAADQRT
eukprot:3861729-Prymnesium_polylepis.1